MSALPRTVVLATLTSLLSLALLAPAATPASALDSPESRSHRHDVVDVAHRGSSGMAPENTLAAVELALAQRAGFVEIDVQRSADGELVVMHDTSLARTTDAEQVFPGRAPWNVGDLTLAEIRRLDAGSWFDPEYAGEPVLTLREVVEAIGGRAGLLLEVKAPSLYPGIETEIDKELRSVPGYLARALATDRLVVQSFDHASMRAFHDLSPEVPVGLLFGSRPTAAQLDEAAGWAEQVNPSYRVTDAALVEAIHERGMTISVYTLDTGRLMREYLAMGVDGIITTYPVVLREVLRRR